MICPLLEAIQSCTDVLDDVPVARFELDLDD
jgi:hypothetical protein